MPDPDFERAEARTSPSAEELPIDVVFDLLRERRRRSVLRYLMEAPGGSTVAELAAHVASTKTNEPERAPTAAERRDAYLALYHGDLPKLASAGVVEFEDDEVVRPTGATHAVASYLRRNGGADDPSVNDRWRGLPARPDPAIFLVGVGCGVAGALAVRALWAEVRDAL